MNSVSWIKYLHCYSLAWFVFFSQGDYPEIIPENFTDEELGIPPDDKDVYPKGYKPSK